MKKGILFSAVLLLALSSRAAVSVVRTANGYLSSTGGEGERVITLAIDVTGADGIIATIGGLFAFGGGATLDGSPMVFISSATGGNGNSGMYRITNSGAGSKNVVFSVPTYVEDSIVAVYAVTGMNQTDPVVAVAQDTSVHGDPLSVSLTGEDGGLVIDVLLYPFSFSNFAPAVGQTGVSADFTYGGSSWKTAVAGSNTMTWTGFGMEDNTAHIAVSLRAASGSTTSYGFGFNGSGNSRKSGAAQ